jgi:hypothetical protein
MTNEKVLMLLNCMATNLVGDVQNGNKLATNYYDALCVAINILQKEQKREQGCEICNTSEIDKLLVKNAQGKNEICFVGGNSKFPKDHHARFCPMCGRELPK